MSDQPLPAPALPTLDEFRALDRDEAPTLPSTRVLVVERKPRGPEHEAQSTIRRIRAFRPLTDISVAYSGWEALEILRHGPSRFDFVVIDVNVGWMDPIDFVRRAQTVDPFLPVVIASPVGFGAVLVPPEPNAGPPRLLPRQLLRAVLRQLRSPPEGPAVADPPLGSTAAQDAAVTPA